MGTAAAYATSPDEARAWDAARKATGKMHAPESAAQAPACQPLENVLKDIVSQRRLGYFADAIDQNGIVHMWFMSRERRAWVSLTVDHDLTACITAEGSEWHFALEPMQSP